MLAASQKSKCSEKGSDSFPLSRPKKRIESQATGTLGYRRASDKKSQYLQHLDGTFLSVLDGMVFKWRHL